LDLALVVAEPHLQSGSAASTAASATPAATTSTAASGNADLPGWLGDPGDGHLPGTATSSASTAGGTRRAGLITAAAAATKIGAGFGPPFFWLLRSDRMTLPIRWMAAG